MEGVTKIDKLAAQGLPDRSAELARLFPEAMTDGKVDVEKLKLLLGGAVEESQERYGLTWPGKQDAIRLAQKQSTGTLDPMVDESVDWDTTKNVIIEGDNLEVLKLLQKSYYGKVKMVFIDPPYNTGNDFVYDDDFDEPTASYLRRSGQIDDAGFRRSSNTEVSGRYHSDWLTMMYPRLVMARNLLSEKGAIYITIDDNEVHNLRHLCDEIFGPENHLATLIWEKVHTRKNSAKYFSLSHDSVVVYARSKETWDRTLLPREGESLYRNPDSDPKGPWKTDPVTAHNYYSAEYTITKPNGVKLSPPPGGYWRFSEATWLRKVGDGEVIWGEGDSYPYVKRYLSEVQDGLVPVTLLKREYAGDSSLAKKEVDTLLPAGTFGYPKPTKLIQRLMETTLRSGELVLDFFAGSGSTAHAVMNLNARDGGGRRFILVQLPEETDNPEFPKISDITRERVRRAGKKVEEEAGEKASSLDLGFRAFRLSESKFKNWDSSMEELFGEDLDVFTDNVSGNATDEQIVHEIMLKAGLRLDVDLEQISVAGETVYSAFGGTFLTSACRKITPEFIDGLLAMEPWPGQVVLLDSAFGDNDSLKVNARHQFASRNGDADSDADNTLRTV